MSFDIIFYSILSFFSIVFGVLYFVYPRLSSILFLLVGMIIPTSNQFMDYTTHSGIYFFDYFFFTLTIYFLLNFLVQRIFLKTNAINLIVILLFFVSYFTFAVLDSVPLDKYLLRDFRPFLTLFYGIICVDLLSKYVVPLSVILNILIFSFIFKLLFFLFLFFGFSFSDLYYQDNLFRYFDASTFIAALFLIVFIFKRQSFVGVISEYKLYFIVFLSIFIVLISNLRILLAALVFIYLIMNKGFFRKILPVFIFLALFIVYSYFMNIDRVTNAFDLQAILTQFATRFYPALEKIYIMSPSQYIYGLGFGSYFEIPWFEYRGLDTKLNTIDSTYLTFFVKYGLFGVIIIYLFFRVMLNHINDFLLKRAILLFYLILFFTLSILYQSGAVLHILFLNMLMISINYEDTTRTISINS